ncbi:MAG: ATP-binding cassette domain-containing protein [Chloroflexi bacterium]|nr:ATP-binding cassette domain-containing protein [Chloroflexota bacterium]
MIKIKNLQKIIDQNPIVDIESLVVAAGQVVALVGPVGSGKAELIELLIGKSQPSKGTIRLADVEPWTEKNLFSQRVGVLFS